MDSSVDMLSLLLDPENDHDYAWADSAYSGEYFDDLLSLGDFEGLYTKNVLTIICLATQLRG
jgi:hypothetical protein